MWRTASGELNTHCMQVTEQQKDRCHPEATATPYILTDFQFDWLSRHQVYENSALSWWENKTCAKVLPLTSGEEVRVRPAILGIGRETPGKSHQRITTDVSYLSATKPQECRKRCEQQNARALLAAHPRDPAIGWAFMGARWTWSLLSTSARGTALQGESTGSFRLL